MIFRGWGGVGWGGGAVPQPVIVIEIPWIVNGHRPIAYNMHPYGKLTYPRLDWVYQCQF